MFLQNPVSQWEIIDGIHCGALNADDIIVNILQLLQIGDGIMNISRRNRRIQSNAAVGAENLMRQIVLAFRFAGTLYMPGLRVGAAHPFVTASAVPLDLFGSFLSTFARSSCQFLQSFFLIDV